MRIPGLTPELSPWWTVFSGAVSVSVGAGILTAYMWGIFAQAIVRQFHWRQTVPALCMFSFLFATGIGSVLFGQAIGRFGVRRSTAAFILVFGASVAVVSVLPDTPSLFYATFALMGAAGIAASAMPYAVAISGWFDRQRGLALGLMVSGSGPGAILAPQLARWLTIRYGWRAGFLVVAAIVSTFPLAGLLFLVRDPPRARAHYVTPAHPTPVGGVSYLRDRVFWLLALPVFGVSIATIGMLTTVIVPLLAQRGFDGHLVAVVVSVAGLGSWAGRIGVGYAMDCVFAPLVLALVLLLTFCGVFLIAVSPALVPSMVGASLIGLALGAEADIAGFLVSRYFSSSVYSNVLGSVWIMWAWGGGVGSYIAGRTFDATGSYDTSLGLFAFFLLFSIAFALRLGPYRYPVAGHSGWGRAPSDLANR